MTTTGAPCNVCNTPFSKCMEQVHRLSEACCDACHRRQTHGPEMTTEDRTTDTRGHTGEACRSCGMTFAKCTTKIFSAPEGTACCGTCAYTDTHNARQPEPVKPEAPAMPGAVAKIMKALDSLDASAQAMRLQLASHTHPDRREEFDDLAMELAFILRDRQYVERQLSDVASDAALRADSHAPLP